MTIESDLASIKLHLGRIADAMEGLLAESGYVPAAPENGKSGKKKSKKKKSGKKDKVVGTPDDDDDGKSDLTLEDIRALLHKLQEQENQAAVKSVLKKHGASTLGKVPEKKYPQLAAAIEKQLDD